MYEYHVLFTNIGSTYTVPIGARYNTKCNYCNEIQYFINYNMNFKICRITYPAWSHFIKYLTKKYKKPVKM